MDCSSVVLIHLVELVDTANPHICQHQSPSLQTYVFCTGVDLDSCSQTYIRTAFTGGVYPSWSQVGYVLEQLRFGHPRITQKHHINLTSNLHVVRSNGSNSSRQQQK